MRKHSLFLALSTAIGLEAVSQLPPFKQRLRENLGYAEPALPSHVHIPATLVLLTDTVPPKIDTLPAKDSIANPSIGKKKKRKNKKENLADTTNPWSPKPVTKPLPYNSYREKPKPQDETPAGDILRSIITDKKKN